MRTEACAHLEFYPNRIVQFALSSNIVRNSSPLLANYPFAGPHCKRHNVPKRVVSLRIRDARENTALTARLIPDDHAAIPFPLSARYRGESERKAAASRGVSGVTFRRRETIIFG